ncbi:type 1 glutamine amidotransferase [Nocardioides sp.]|uniref:type 1 glutamine amidotransferase n=1 Tax=Nocardioides sp. TaxID=35761 RepID=UPI0037831CE2
MTAPRVLVVEHEAGCPPALLGTWLAEAGCELDVARPYAGDPLPGLAPYDALVVLGGSMGAGDDGTHPWLGPVRELVREARATDLPTLGICLGHQLVATALGGEVARNPHGQQLGLIGVGWTEAARDDRLLGPLSWPRRGVHWNDDVVVVLPAGAVLLAETGRGEVQAARFAPLVWGVQLHPEVDADVLRPWGEEDRGSHETRGIDTDALLRDIDAASAELEAAWRPLATGLAELAAEHRDRAARTEDPPR